MYKRGDTQEINQTNALQYFKQAKEAFQNNELVKAQKLFTKVSVLTILLVYYLIF
jgi:hypothetical protein